MKATNRDLHHLLTEVEATLAIARRGAAQVRQENVPGTHWIGASLRKSTARLEHWRAAVLAELGVADGSL